MEAIYSVQYNFVIVFIDLYVVYKTALYTKMTTSTNHANRVECIVMCFSFCHPAILHISIYRLCYVREIKISFENYSLIIRESR